MSSTSATSTTINTQTKTDYLQPSIPSSNSSSSYDPSQSPLALLAQTCSSIGKDCPSPPSSSSTTTTTTITATTTSTSGNLAPSVLSSLVTRNSSNPTSIPNQDKSILSSKRSSSTQIISNNVHRKSTVPLKPTAVTKSSSFVDSNPFSNYLPPLFDPTASTSAATAAAAALFLRSSLAYLAVQQQQQQQAQVHSYSTVCTMPGCLQCETLRHILSASTTVNEPFVCHWHSCNRRFSSNEELNDHIQRNHRSVKVNHIQRFHPYLKPSMMINNNDQLPFFYPHLSLSPMTGSTRRMNNNTNSNN